MKKIDKPTVVFVGGGTGGHIYPGLAVVDALKEKIDVTAVWIGSSRGMDKRLVEKSGSVDDFIGIPSGKLRRYFSLQNFFDLFKIAAGFVASFFALARIKPIAVFSKGGFVSVPPCCAAKLLGIPVFTHECDFTPGLATRLNARFATKVLVSYTETASFFASAKEKVCVTGNPVRPVFYTANAQKGRAFLGLSEVETKPILLVLGGSLGAKQINDAVTESLGELCEHFIVVHQTGNGGARSVNGVGSSAGGAQNAESESARDAGACGSSVRATHDESEQNTRTENAAETTESLIAKKQYLPFAFIYGEMPDVLSCADVVFSRAGANALWEASVLGKAMVLLPLAGSGTRGDQVENAEYFVKHDCARMIDPKSKTVSRDAVQMLKTLLNKDARDAIGNNARALIGKTRGAEAIANVLIAETPLSLLPQKKSGAEPRAKNEHTTEPTITPRETSATAVRAEQTASRETFAPTPRDVAGTSSQESAAHAEQVASRDAVASSSQEADARDAKTTEGAQ